MLRFTTAGESHGPALISILKGAPAGIPLAAATSTNRPRAPPARLRRRPPGCRSSTIQSSFFPV